MWHMIYWEWKNMFGRFKISEEQMQEIVQQLKEAKTEMENCLSDYAIGCWELFRVQEGQNVQLLYWVRIVKTDNDSYELQFMRELQPTW